MTTEAKKYDANRLEALVHAGFEETLGRCSTQYDMENPRFVECIKASGVNYGTIIPQWINYSNAQVVDIRNGMSRDRLYWSSW